MNDHNNKPKIIYQIQPGLGFSTSQPKGDNRDGHVGVELDPIVGIDLGTTNSLVAVTKNGEPVILQSREGKNLLPSIVAFGKDSSQTGIVVGYAAKSQALRDPKHAVFSVKRLLGRAFDDLKAARDILPYPIIAGEGIVRIQIGDKAYTPIEISAMILKELKRGAEASLGTPVHRAVITVPAYFNDAQRQATRAAGRLAGWDVVRIINEPTAASLAYGLNRKREGLIAVYDLGGGTFDVSILKLHDGIFEVLATNGDSVLGGDDLDQAIVSTVWKDIEAAWNTKLDRGDMSLRASFLHAAERLKIAFSENIEATFRVKVGERLFEKKWTLPQFEALIRPVLERTIPPCLNALKDAGIEASSLSTLTDVILVGGPTRLRAVKQVVSEIFKREPNSSMHPDEVVAAGAAIQADILAGNNKDFLLLDVVPLSLGIETYGGLMSALIFRNTRIPAVAREVFTTFVDNQTGVDIHVLQGERERTSDNRSLARFKLAGIQPMPAGMPRVEVTFLIDADGILEVSAKDLKTGNEQSIEVRPSYGLTDDQIERMLGEGMGHAEEDLTFRQIVEAKNKAEGVLRAAELKLPDAFRLLPKEDAQVIEQDIAALRVALRGDDLQKIREASAQLNKSTIRLAELLLKETIQR